MLQQGQVHKLKTRGVEGKPTWAYRYRVDGRGPSRPQMSGFAKLITIAKLHWLLAKATAAFGATPVVDLRSDEIGAWRTTLPEGHRFEATLGAA